MPTTDTVADAAMQSVAEARRGRLVRRAVIVLLALFVAAASLGWLGYRQGGVRAAGATYSIEVSYPRVTRGGLPSNWALHVARIDGGALPGEISIRSASGYFGHFDQNGLDPQPDSTWNDGSSLEWTFDPPPGAVELEVSFDARLQPNSRGWFDGRSALVVDGVEEVTVSYRTWVAP